MEVIKNSPIFGVGTYESGPHIGGHAVHNSFIQPYSDLGLFGGTFLVGAFFQAYRRLFQLQLQSAGSPDPALDPIRPYIMGALTGYVITMMSTNHSYTVTTYGILGFAAATIRLADDDEPPPGEWLDGRMMGRLACVSILFLVGMNVYVRLMVRY
jgi:hypothetical protein